MDQSKETKEMTVKRSKCDLMEKTLSILLKAKTENHQVTSIDSTDIINNLIRHLREKSCSNKCPKDCKQCSKGCAYCPKDSVYLLIGVYYFELFKIRLNKFKSYVINKEIENVSVQSKEKDKNWDNIKMKNSDSYPEMINFDSQRKVIEYLFKAIDIWSKLLHVKEKLKTDLINQLDVFEILKSCYFIFTFYGAIKYVKITCTIFTELALLHAQSNKNYLLFAYYCQIKFNLDHGILNKAKNSLKIANSLIENMPKNRLKNMSVEIYLIKIVDCELRLLLNEEIEKAAIDLKALCCEEYFKPVTVVSGYIKSLAFFLCTKFSAKMFPNQDLYHYFNESFVFVKSLFTKWYPFLSESTPNDKQININSPIWLEFAVAKFTLEFSLTYYYHSINCSVVDIHFFFNILVIKLARIYCSLLWLSRILIISCYYEKHEVQKVKINNIKSLFIRKKCDLNKLDNKTYIKKQNSISSNISTNLDNEAVTLQDDSLDMRSKEFANCSHLEDTPIYLLKKSMLRNPILSEDVELVTNYDYDKELENLDDFYIPDLIVIRQELLLLLYLINESKANFIRYFKQIDLDILNAIYLENLSTALNVNIETLNRNHQNLINSQFNLRCLLIYLQHVELDSSLALDLTRNVLKKATSLGHSYEIRCFVTELVLIYVESLFKEICSGNLKILEYNFLGCEKYLIESVRSNSPVRNNLNLRSKVKPKAPKKVRNYKMDEIKDYIQEMYDLDCQKKSAKLNFTDSDEEEENTQRNKENLKLKVNKLKNKRNENSENDEVKIENEFNVKKSAKSISSRTFKDPKSIQNRITEQEFSNLNELNNLNNRVGNLCLDDTCEEDVHEYLVNETNTDLYAELRRLLFNVLDLFGNYPSIKHYNAINTLLFRLSICEESTYGNESAYYFSEICQANALRYKTIQHLNKKCKYVPIKYDSKVLAFNCQIESKNDELMKMLSILPSKWRVVQIQFLKGFDSQSDLFLARYQRDRSPIIIKINVSSEKYCRKFTDEFDQIIQLSNDTVKEKDSKSFWKLRYALDERLRRLLMDVDSTWINCFIGMFLGECLCVDQNCSNCAIFQAIENHIKHFADTQKLTCSNLELLRVVCESFVYLKEESFNHAMVTLFGLKEKKRSKVRFDGLYDQCVEIAKKRQKFNTVEELKEIVLKRNKFGPVGLITGNTLENFPFESLISLRMLNLEMFRIPSIRFLNWMYINLRRTNQRIKSGVSDKDVYYLINPSNNLSHTEEFFKIKFEDLRKKSDCNWDGLIGKIPTQFELQKALEKKDIYIYFGHNSGVRYLGKLHECNVNCLSLVIGCSSAALSNQDQMVESFGSSYYFLINGCPTYLGCLWNVTDRDIDRFAERLLKHTFKIYDQEDENNNIEKCSSITKALALSRDICKLKFLNGSAPVIRGLPISMKLE